MKSLLLGGVTFKSVSVDDEDAHLLEKFPWRIQKNKTVNYAVSKLNGKTIYLHHLILPIKKGFLVDHKDTDGLNCQRDNLRYANHSQSGANTRQVARTKSGYKGVSWHKQRQKWQAEIRINGQHISLGLWENKELAALAYNKAAISYFGEFANLNIIEELNGKRLHTTVP